MKKNFKLILALVLAAMMIASMIPAMAANDGSITISNTTSGKSYSIYKVFDATYADGTPKKVAYTYDGSNTEFLDALQAESSPFTATLNLQNTYNIEKKSTASDSNVIDFIKAHGPTQDATTKEWSGGKYGSAVSTKNGNGSSLVFDNLAYGYYFITSTVGAAVTINSALKDVTVIDKNQGSTLDKQEQIATQGYYIDENGHKVEDPIPTANVGDTVSYKVVGTITQYQGDKKVVAFKWTDAMSAGLTADRNVQIKINGEAPLREATITYSPVEAGSASTVTTITLPTVNTEGAFLYGSVATYEITYTAKINEAAITRDVENNTVDMDYTEDNTNWRDVDNDETKVKDYKITLTKQDADNASKLAGAQFKLYDALTGGSEIPLVLVPNTTDGVTGYGTKTSTVNNVYRHAKAGETPVEIVTGTTGIVEIQGLANGTYYFEETVAPDGYNILTARTPATTITNADATITVNNAKGSTLPTTGGIGTTIFYIAGSILVLAAAILLITKRRMGNND